jgi:hypothetical protein
LVQATLGHAWVATTGHYLHARPTDSSSNQLAANKTCRSTSQPCATCKPGDAAGIDRAGVAERALKRRLGLAAKLPHDSHVGWNSRVRK